MRTLILITILIFSIIACTESNKAKSSKTDSSIRKMVDTIGFAHLDWQVDSVVNRINRAFPDEMAAAKSVSANTWRVAICPHDDYTYASWQYPALLRNLKAKTVIIFGVAHKARQLNISDQLVFDNYPYWHGPYGKIKLSSFREELMGRLPGSYYLVSDTLQKIEHSVESMLPFVQHFNKNVEIVSILVPAMNTERMWEISGSLASAISGVMKSHHLEWGRDVALLVTSDAVHYGDEEWGGKNMAPFGADSAGYVKAIDKEHVILDSCLVGEVTMDKIRKFTELTVQPNDYKEYRWTWCGRYSIPFGLMVAIGLQQETNGQPLAGKFIGYSTSIDHRSLPVDDLRMGKTAKANIRHWVGYASVGYE
jgi:AmmeMemoRadiSam system protein B